MKVVINRCFGGFGLSEKAFELLLKRKGIEFEKKNERYSKLVGASYYEKGFVGDMNHYLSPHDFYRDRADEDLIAVVEELGAEAETRYSELAIIEVPDDVEWEIDEYDGREHIAEKHRTWY